MGEATRPTERVLKNTEPFFGLLHPVGQVEVCLEVSGGRATESFERRNEMARFAF